jgi:hypothetical protein
MGRRLVRGQGESKPEMPGKMRLQRTIRGEDEITDLKFEF